MFTETQFDRLLLAIDTIIKDVDKRFDECLVEKFIEYIRYFSVNSSRAAFTLSCRKSILDRVQQYLGNRAFVMLNQTRAYKVFSAIARTEYEFEELEPYFDALWDSLDTIVLNHNLAAITVLLSMFDELVHRVAVFQWLMCKTIEPSIRLTKHNFEISNIATLLRYYISDSNNYHTTKATETLLGKLIYTTCRTDPSDINDAFFLDLKMNFEHLLATDTTTAHCVMRNVGENDNGKWLQVFDKLFDVSRLLDESLSLHVKDKSEKNLHRTCQMLALIEATSHQSESRFLMLKKEKKLEAMIIYLASFDLKRMNKLEKLMTYILYPILMDCNDDQARKYINTLGPEDRDGYFIKENLSSTTVSCCLNQLSRITKSPDQAVELTQCNIDLIINSILTYVKSNQKAARNQRNVQNCFQIFRQLHRFQGRNPIRTLAAFHEIMTEAINDSEAQFRPFIIELVEVIRVTHEKCNKDPDHSLRDQLRQFSLKTIELALLFEDHDIMTEFAQFFHTNKFLTCDETSENILLYVRLIWQHMYQKAKDTEHPELLGLIACLLIETDSQVDASILDEIGLRRHIDIPKLVGTILVERQAVLLTVERIIDFISVENTFEKSSSGKKIREDYIVRLQNLGLTGTEGLSHMVIGLCATIRGETGEATRLRAIHIIRALAMEVNDNFEFVLEGLAKTGVLRTLFEVVTVSLYGKSMYEKAVELIDCIRKNLVAKIDNASERMMKASGSDVDERIAGLFTTNLLPVHNYTSEVEVKSHNEPQASSLVDDILNYDLLADGILDCY